MTDAEKMVAAAFRGDLLLYQRNVARAERATAHAKWCEELELSFSGPPHVNFNGLG